MAGNTADPGWADVLEQIDTVLQDCQRRAEALSLHQQDLVAQTDRLIAGIIGMQAAIRMMRVQMTDLPEH